MKKILFFFIFLSLITSAHALWWDQGWLFKQPLTISAPHDQNTYKYTRLNWTLNTSSLIASGKLQSDCDDLRIIRDDAEVLDLAVNNCGTTTTTISFLLRDRIAKNNSIQNYSLYYGNSTAPTFPNDRREVDGLWDGFNDGIIDSNWVTIGNWSESDGNFVANPGRAAMNTKRSFEIPYDWNVTLEFIIVQNGGDLTNKNSNFMCFGNEINADKNFGLDDGFCPFHGFGTNAHPGKIAHIFIDSNIVFTQDWAIGLTDTNYYGSTAWRISKTRKSQFSTNDGDYLKYRWWYDFQRVVESDLPSGFTINPSNWVSDSYALFLDFNTATSISGGAYYSFQGDQLYPIILNTDYNSTTPRNARYDAVLVNYYDDQTKVTAGEEKSQYDDLMPFCKPALVFGDSSEKIDVVFVGSGFPDLNTFDWVVDDMIDANGEGFGLLHYEPFKENREKFNFWKVNALQTFSGGMVFNEFSDMQWRHKTQYHVEARNAVINDCGLINESKPLFIALMVTPKVRPHAEPNFLDNGSGAAYVTIGTEYYGSCNYLNPPFCAFPTGPIVVQDFTPFDNDFNLAYSRQEIQSIVVHEFGHSFGGLADEYVEDNVFLNINLSATLSANCDNNFLGNVCSKWSSITTSCVPGCTTDYFYRPFIQSMMRNPNVYDDVNFMPVSVKELQKDINSYFEVTESVLESINYSYLLEISNNGLYFDLNRASVINQTTNQSQVSQGNYEVTIKDNSNNVLYDTNILVPTGYLYSPSSDWFGTNGIQTFIPDANDYIVDQNIPFSISLPYFSDGGVIDFFDVNGVNVLSVDISQFSTKIPYAIGYGGGLISNVNYEVEYQIVDQPVGVLTSTNYTCELGPIP